MLKIWFRIQTDWLQSTHHLQFNDTQGAKNKKNKRRRGGKKGKKKEGKGRRKKKEKKRKRRDIVTVEGLSKWFNTVSRRARQRETCERQEKKIMYGSEFRTITVMYGRLLF